MNPNGPYPLIPSPLISLVTLSLRKQGRDEGSPDAWVIMMPVVIAFTSGDGGAGVAFHGLMGDCF